MRAHLEQEHISHPTEEYQITRISSYPFIFHFSDVPHHSPFPIGHHNKNIRFLWTMPKMTSVHITDACPHYIHISVYSFVHKQFHEH